MNYKDWHERRMIRSDLSKYLVHLTRDAEELESIEVLFNILDEKKLIGSTTKSGFICGDIPAVCFQDTPLQSIGFNIWHEQKKSDEKIRYKPTGLIFKKEFIFKKGGRPVIYDTRNQAKNYLPEDKYWKIVSTDLSNSKKIIDWTHEREWRIPNDLEFELSDVGVILASFKDYRKFIDLCNESNKNILEKLLGITNLSLLF